VKYAYPSPEKGLVWVRFVREKDELLLSVRDSGRGLPDDIESRSGGGLGMKLVKSLVTQVHGELVTLGPPGTVFQITVAAA